MPTIVGVNPLTNESRLTNVLRGLQGAKGDKGDTGDTGLAGTNGAAGSDGVGVPSGGTTGQVLSKNSGTDYDTEWSDPGISESLSIAYSIAL